MATPFHPVQFQAKQAETELTELGSLLNRPELSEKYDILPFFRKRDQLCAMIGTYLPGFAGTASLIAREFSFAGDFRADLLVGSRDTEEYLAIEFEEGRTTSLFQKLRRTSRKWSPRFEQGYSQLIDWFAALDDFKKTDKFRREFGPGHVQFTGLLVVGRNAGLSVEERRRLRWRSSRVRVDSHAIHCVTYDDLYETLRNRLRLFIRSARRTK